MSVGSGKAERALNAAAAPPGPAQAIAYLAFESGRTDIADADLAQVADALGRQPEAMLLAARLLAERTGAGPAVYLEALAEHAASSPETPAYPKTYRAAVLTSFEIVEHEPAMRGHAPTSILALAAYLPDGPTPLSLLEGAPEHYPAEVRPFIADNRLCREALGLLDRLGLVDSDETGRSFAVSGLTKAVVRDLLAEAGEAEVWQRAAAELGARTAPKSGVEPIEPLPLSPMPSRDDAIALFEAAEELAGSGQTEAALAHHETARAAFARIAEAAPDDLQAQADLAASHGKIGLTLVGAGRAREGLDWLASCRHLITQLQWREPANDLWPRYVASLDSEIAALEVEEDEKPEADAVTLDTPAADRRDGGSVGPLVRALSVPDEGEATASDADAVVLMGGDATDEEPVPLELDGEREPPKVFTSESLFAEEAGLLPPVPPPPRRSGFLARFFSRRA